jgi:methyl-accepting chemotaxis protein
MTKRVLEISISVLAIACVIALIIGFFSLKPFYNSGLKIMADSHEVLQDSKLLIKELREGVAETKKTSNELVKLLQNSSLLFKEMTEAVGEANETPKEFVKLIQEIRLLAGEVKDTVSEAKKSQIEMAKSADRTKDILYELAIASFVLALSEERIISYVEADQMILQSIETIEGRSERFGKLAKSIIDFKKGQRIK